MTELSENVEFKKELRLSLKGSFSDLFLKSDLLKNDSGLQQIIRTCGEHKIDPLDIRSKDTSLIDDIGFGEGIARDALGRKYDSIASKVLNKIIITLLSSVEDPNIEWLAKMQKTLKADVLVSTKDKSAAINANLYSLELKPFVRFYLLSIGFEKQLAKIKFKIDFKAKLKDLGVHLGDKNKISSGILEIGVSASLKEIETPFGTQPVNLQFGSGKFEIKLPG